MVAPFSNCSPPFVVKISLSSSRACLDKALRYSSQGEKLNKEDDWTTFLAAAAAGDTHAMEGLGGARLGVFEALSLSGPDGSNGLDVDGGDGGQRAAPLPGMRKFR